MSCTPNFSPSEEELVWVREKTDTDEHQLALALALKCFQKLGRFPKTREVPVAADLINVALEKLTQARLELPAFSTLDAMESTVRGEVNGQIFRTIWSRLGRAALEGLLVAGPGGKSPCRG